MKTSRSIKKKEAMSTPSKCIGKEVATKYFPAWRLEIKGLSFWFFLFLVKMTKKKKKKQKERPLISFGWGFQITYKLVCRLILVSCFCS